MKPLTTREMEVMQLVAQGYSNKEAAEILTCSIKTVEKHKQSVYYKWNVDSVIAMVRIAIRTGELSMDTFLDSRVGENIIHEKPQTQLNRALV